jgi:hypothetical protein
VRQAAGAEFRRQAVHENDVTGTAANPARLPPTTDLPEARPPVGADGPLIGAQDPQENVVESKRRESVLQHQ